MSARYQFREAILAARPVPPPARARRRYFLASLLFVWAAITACILPRPLPIPATLEIGSVWNHGNVFAPAEFTVRDHDAEAAARRWLQARHPRVFTVAREMAPRARVRANRVIEVLEANLATTAAHNRDALADSLFSAVGVRLTPASAEAILRETTSSLKPLLEASIHALLEDGGITPDRVMLDSARQHGNLLIADSHQRITTASATSILGWPTEALHVLETSVLPEFQAPPALAAAVADIIGEIVEPNVHYDPATSRQQFEEAASRISIQRTVQPGSLIIRPGETIGETAAAALRIVTAHHYRRNIENALGAALAAALAIILILLYNRRYRTGLVPEPRIVLMMALPVIMAISLGRVAVNYLGPDFAAAALPAGMVGMVATILFDARHGLILALATPLLFAIGDGSAALPIIFAGTLTGAVGAFSLMHLRERWHVLLAGLHVAITCLLANIAMALISPGANTASEIAVQAAVNGLACYGITMMVLPLFESVFKSSTAWRLLELTSGDHPLLNRLEREAPGTHEHSLNVAKLAEAACDEIGADALLARAGAYFHDIGKLQKPRYFIENQETPEEKRIHDRLSPSMSAIIIRDHVRHGIQMAREHKLPDRIVDFIAQHHGTSSIAYFLAKERRRIGPEEKLAEETFRYPGPRPQSIEVGIVMIADSLDATATAMFAGKGADEDALQKLVRDTVARLFADEQLDECPITLEQLSAIQGALVRALKSRFHRRIQYPGKAEPPKRAESRGESTHDPDAQETVDVPPPSHPSASNRPLAVGPTESDTIVRRTQK